MTPLESLAEIKTETWVFIVTALFGGAGLFGTVSRALAIPKERAETAQTQAQTFRMVIVTLREEVDRLNDDRDRLRLELRGAYDEIAELRAQFHNGHERG